MGCAHQRSPQIGRKLDVGARRRIAFPNSSMSTPHTKTHELNTTDETQQLARFSKQNAMNEDDDETENMQE